MALEARPCERSFRRQCGCYIYARPPNAGRLGFNWLPQFLHAPRVLSLTLSPQINPHLGVNRHHRNDLHESTLDVPILSVAAGVSFVKNDQIIILLPRSELHPHFLAWPTATEGPELFLSPALMHRHLYIFYLCLTLMTFFCFSVMPLGSLQYPVCLEPGMLLPRGCTCLSHFAIRTSERPLPSHPRVASLPPRSLSHVSLSSCLRSGFCSLKLFYI